VVVSGYSGIGKSSVVQELHKVLLAPRALFGAGKFDQYKRDVPYATLAQAFRNLVRDILGKSDAEVTRWRDAFREVLVGNGQLMIQLIPELEILIGPQSPVSDLSSGRTKPVPPGVLPVPIRVCQSKTSARFVSRRSSMVGCRDSRPA